MTYNRALVEHLLPAVWDRLAAYGMRAEHQPDHDMPRAKPNPKTGNNLPAYLADIRTAWRCAPLTLVERRALLLRYGLDLEYGEAGVVLGVDKKNVYVAAERGVGRMTAWLNGDEYASGYDIDSEEVAAA